MTEREEHLYDCEVVIDRAPGMKVVALKAAARETFAIGTVEYPQYSDVAGFSALIRGDVVEMSFELSQGTANMSGAAVRALTVGTLIAERAGYGPGHEVLRLKVEVA